MIGREDTSVVAIHDCDTLDYDRAMLARLVYPVANPAFPYQLSKGFYARVGEGKMNGRVTRLLISPLLIAINKLVGQNDYIDYLRSFRYPLSGEMAMRVPMLPSLRIPSDWGLEIGVLSEAYRNLGRTAVCQVEIADSYDHKHQSVSAGDARGGLNRMSTDICKAIFRKLATEGVVFTPNVFRTLKATYYRRALDLLDVYADDATMNGLSIDRHAEEKIIELFAENILLAGTAYLDNPHEMPFIPNWSRVHAADPSLIRDLVTAVREDSAEHKPLPFEG
jgi:glucosyl-3-phosphoglycerate synthase